jgi:hypothetical protein
MKSQGHFEHDELIDFVEGDVERELAGEIRNHLETCETCRAYVESLRRAFAILETDEVPEQSPGYWDFFEQRVRARSGSAAGAAQRTVPGAAGRSGRGVAGKPVPGRSLVFSWVAGLAAAAALVVTLWWLPEARLQGPGQLEPLRPATGMTRADQVDVPWPDQAEAPQVDPVDFLLADLSTGEIIESMSTDPGIGLMFMEIDTEAMAEIDDYLAETTGIDELVDQLSTEERQIFISNLKANMKEDDNTSAITNGSARKGC